MAQLMLCALLATLVLADGPHTPPPQGAGPSQKEPRLEWDKSTLVRVQTGTYGRMIRLPGGDILCSYEAAGKSWVCRSSDNGKTWAAPVLVRQMPYATAANPELLLLLSGRVLLFYNQRPNDKNQPFAIGYCSSDDNGLTWNAAKKLLYEAGNEPGIGCWEPAGVQLPSGEIQLFFANEFAYKDTADQEITMLLSLDNGTTWSAPRAVSYRAGHRDGMPVPLLLQGKRSVLLAIEDNGLAPGNKLHPALIDTARAGLGQRVVVNGTSPRRWGAIVPPLPGHVYAGAPHIRQMPSGETVLSCQSDEGERAKAQMVVYVGDRTARNFRHRSVPFEVAPEVSGVWNSLFVKDATTVTAISDTTINGVRGLWAIDGRLVRK